MFNPHLKKRKLGIEEIVKERISQFVKSRIISLDFHKFLNIIILKDVETI